MALYELDILFESRLVADDGSRAELAALWPIARIPVLRDEATGLTLPESSTIIEHLDGLASGGSRLVPADRAAAVQTRPWDRFHDQYVAAPMQKIVTDRLRPGGRDDPEARPWRDIFPLPWPSDTDEHGGSRPGHTTTS